MSRSALFTRLRTLFALGRHGAERGLTEPSAIRASAAGLDRRQFLELSAATAAVATLPLGSSGCATSPGDVKVAIVGGGIAGLHCAWRLIEAGVDATVYEATDRPGGRMFSARDLFLDGQVCELGGELIDTNHATMFELADEFGIALDDRLADEPTDFRREVWWVGGVAVDDDEILRQFVAVAPKMVLDVTAAEEDDAAFEALDRTSLRAWLDANVPTDAFAELHAVLDSAYRGEFGLETPSQSALNLLYLIGSGTTDEFLIFGDSDERWHAHDGNDVFPTALADAIGTDRVALSHTLTKAVLHPTGYRLTFQTPDGAVEVDADHVVFALPFSRLRDVDTRDLGLSLRKLQVVNSLGYGTNAKVMAGFTSRVWKTDHNASGSVTTDRPFQQTWDTSVGQDGASGILTNFLGGAQGLASEAGTAAEWITAQLPDLEAVFPGVTAAFTGTAVRMHWPTVPTQRGSYTCYLPGQWAFWGTEGAREGNLHFCGEHTSADFQGWMEGGAETGALVAAEILDDHGIAPSERAQRILVRKTAVPQPTYHGDGRPLPVRAWRERRAILAELARARR